MRQVHLGVDKDSGLFHLVVTTFMTVHNLPTPAELLHGDDEVMYGDAGYQGIGKRRQKVSITVASRFAMRPGKRRCLPDTPDGSLQDLIETAKSHIRSMVEDPLRVIKQQFGHQKTQLRGLVRNRYRFNVLVALTNLFLARRQLLATV